MGAAPSRETIEHSLPQPPFYGQRQQIVLIPLLKKFFPSADCSLFVQLYEARCDPAVRYYYYANDGVEGISRTPPTSPLTPMVRTATEGFDEDESPLYLADKVGNVPFHCPPMDVFPGTPFTREAMYDAYVTNGGERLVYDTDAEMLRAYRDDPSAVRPLPCAVAFLYHKSMSHAPAVHSGSAGEAQHGGGDKGGDAEAHAAGAAVATSFPEDCSEVLGCYVKATGFMGDVQCLGQRHTRGKTPSLNYEMQMFLTKSAGDHNRTHVLLTAVYTYAEQWQRACLHCVPFDLTGQHAPPNASTEGTAEHGKRLDDAAFFYKAFTQTHEMLVEASRAGGHHPHGTSGATGSGEDAGEATNSTPTTTAARLHDAQNPSRYWAPPPLSALVLRSRRANVPLLCFLREVRACIANMFLFHVKYYYHEHQHERQDKESTEEMVAAAAVGGNISVRPTLHPDMLPHGCWHMWMQNTLASSAEIDEMSIESVLNVHCTARFMQSIVEYIVACLLHNLNPLEAFRAQPNHGAAVHANANGSSGAGAEAAAEAKVVVKGEGNEGRDAAHASAEAAATTTAALVPHSLSLFRLPDEDMLVGTWPPRPVDQLAELPSKSVEADILTKWRDLYTRHYLFWVIGPNVESRRSATVALLDWVQTRQSPVRWGYHLDEHDREIPSTPSDAYKNNISTAIYPSSSLEDYLCTVTINGTDEEMVRGDTVLCLMPVDEDATPESRVLRVCRLPLEELLLGELRNASKLAREAGPNSPRWVRQTPSPGGAYKGCVLHAHDPAAGDAEANAVVCSGVELPAVPPEADGIVGDGTSCLWRVDLLEQIHRVIAVTPQFLKPIRKKHPKKKKLPAKAVVAHGTATQVFLAAPAPSTGANPTGGAAEPMKDTAVDTKSEMTTSGPEHEAAGAAAVVVQEEAAETMPVAMPEPSEAVSKPATTTMSKNQKKKAKKAAAAATAAAAVDCSADATTAAKTTAAAAAAAVMEPAEDTAAKAEEDPAFTTNKAEAPAAPVHPEPGPDSPAGASASKKAKKAQAAKQTLEKSPAATTEKMAHADAPTVPAAAAAAAAPLSTETAKSMPKPPQPIAPLPPIPAGEIDPNAVDGNKSRSSSQRTPVPAVKSVSPAAASTSPPTPHYPAGYWGYGAGQTHPAAHPPGYNGYSEPPSYDIYAYAPPPPPPPMPAAAAAAAAAAPAAGAYGVYDYDTHNAYAQTGAPPPPPPFNGHGGGRVPPGYANYYYAQGGYASGYAPEDGYRGASYDEGYGAMPEGEAGDVRGNGGDVGGADQGLYACEGGVVHVAEQIHEELVTLTAPEGTDGAALAHAGREESDAHTTQLSISRQDTTSSSYQRHVSFGTEAAALTVAAAVEEAANGAVPSSHLARAAGTVAPPLPLCEEMAASPIHAEPGPNASHGGMDKPRGSVAFSPQHSQSAEDNNAASLSVGGSNLHFQTDELHSLITNSSSVPAIPVGVHHHARYVSSPYQQQISTFEDAGVVTTAGAGPAGSSVNVHVRVRHHHHHTHSRTTSFFSDSTADHANHHAHPTTAIAAAVIGEGSISGLHPSHSFASMGSSSIVFHGVGGTAGSNHAGSMRERAHSGVGGDYGSASRGEHSPHSHPQRPHIPGAASSTRSGETTSTARLMDKRSGTYRWDWRTAGLDMGEED